MALFGGTKASFLALGGFIGASSAGTLSAINQNTFDYVVNFIAPEEVEQKLTEAFKSPKKPKNFETKYPGWQWFTGIEDVLKFQESKGCKFLFVENWSDSKVHSIDDSSWTNQEKYKFIWRAFFAQKACDKGKKIYFGYNQDNGRWNRYDPTQVVGS